jgi:hypothetical protein
VPLKYPTKYRGKYGCRWECDSYTGRPELIFSPETSCPDWDYLWFPQANLGIAEPFLMLNVLDLGDEV